MGIKKILVAIVLALLLILVFIQYSNNPQTGAGAQFQNSSLVPYSQIISGGPPPDGIPSIDHPNFVSARNATFLSNSSTVIGISIDGQARAYPLLILVWHEIVNDNVDGMPIAITYCPLCYSSLAFIRQINGTTVQFGTSGKLYNNNLVMYDRRTKSLWSEIWGKAIAGKLTGYTLQRVPIDVMPWGIWKQIYPSTLVLSENTGFSRPYGTDPYGDYYTSPSLLFPINHVDTRLFPKTVVQGISLNGVSKAYPFSVFNKNGMVIKDSLGNQSLIFFGYESGVARAFRPVANGRQLSFSYSNGNFTDTDTNSIWGFNGTAFSGPMKGQSLSRIPTTTAFWFAWSAFYPNTSIYNQS